MFVPADPRLDEMLALAAKAMGAGLEERDRPRWRELCAQLLGAMHERAAIPQRRQMLRAAARVDVHLLAPEPLQGLVSCTVGAGGLSLGLREPLPAGAEVELSIQLPGRKVPMFARGQVVYSNIGGAHGYTVGMAFTEAEPADREALEALAAREILARSIAQ